MLKAVIDTNIFVSGLIKSPSCRKIINALEKSKFILVVSPATLAELIGVIARPKFHDTIKRETAAKLIEVIKAQALLVKPSFSLEVIKDDAEDNRFLEAAITAKANCLVSLDKHLIALDTFRNLPIITPSRFLKLLRKT